MDDAAWLPGSLDAHTSPVDLSFLNAPEKPAGRHGFLAARGDRLVFADGSVARFWGANLAAAALFSTPPDEVRRQARRLSALGFNLVRIHHHDSDWVDPNIFGAGAGRAARVPDAAMLERLDWWFKCLKDEGIYVWLDLQVGRQLRASDRIDDFAEISGGADVAPTTGYAYVNASIRRAMQRFSDSYLDHLNRLTGLRYRDDPAIAAVLIANENDATGHYGNALLPDKRVPVHTAAFMHAAADFAERTGLAPDRVWRSWEPGPAGRSSTTSNDASTWR